MKENNVISLASHISNKTPIETFYADDLGAFELKNEQITLRRMFAFMCDFSVILLFTNLAVSSYAFFVKEFMLPMSMGQKTAMMGSVWALGMASAAVIGFTYFFYCNYFLNGKTLGSHLMKLTIIDDSYPFVLEQDNYAPKATQSFRRTAGYMACYFSFGTFFFLSLLNEEKRGVPDFISNTRVVSDEWLKGFKSHKEFHQEQVRININSLDRAA